MNILIHDYCGHPFQVELSRALAGRGHNVLHLYSSTFQTPKGDVVKRADDPLTFNIKGIGLVEEFKKYSYIKRFFQEKTYTKILLAEIKDFNPDVIICANTPILTCHQIIKYAKSNEKKFILWLQDFLSIGISKIFRKKYLLLGYWVGRYFSFFENSNFINSHAIVVITDDFKTILLKSNVPPDKVFTIPNWAPLNEIKLREKNNPWSQSHNLVNKFCILYSGTLGLKHNPEILIAIADHYRSIDNVRVVVISEGQGAEYLIKRRDELCLNNMIILNFQPYREFSNVLASADILIAILEKDAGIFSVPSKVLSYHCAGKPIVLSVPKYNLASKIILEAKSGVVCDPDDIECLITSIDKFMNDNTLRSQIGSNSRKYAEKYFDIQKIADYFENVFNFVLRSTD